MHVNKSLVFLCMEVVGHAKDVFTLFKNLKCSDVQCEHKFSLCACALPYK